MSQNSNGPSDDPRLGPVGREDDVLELAGDPATGLLDNRQQSL